jgi:DNA-binding response OmpR family regulator
MSDATAANSPGDAPPIRFATAPGGGRVAYAVHGDGPLLVCPPWWVTHVERDFSHRPFRALFERLGRVARVVRYDRLGNGLSDPSPAKPTLESEVAQLECVIDALEAPRVSLLAVSSAAPPALAFAARHPLRVERLVLYGAYARGSELASPEVQHALAAIVRAHWGLASHALADIFVPDAGGEELEALARWQRSASDGNTAAELLELTYGADVSALLPEVRARTTVIHRRGDRAVPFEAGRRLASLVPGARLLALDGRAHPPWEGASDVAETLVQLLGSPRTEPAATSLAEGPRLDGENCALELDGQRVALTPLELGVLEHLASNTARVVTREDLIHAVWKQASTGSNVVDAVVRTLRKKLGRYRDRIETVTGHGYRFRGW